MDVTRGEFDDVRRRISNLEDSSKEMLDLLHDIDKKTAIMHSAIMGDVSAGITGVVGKIRKLEEWQAKHGSANSLEKHEDATMETPKERKVNGWAIFAACIGAFGVLGSLTVAIWAVLK